MPSLSAQTSHYAPYDDYTLVPARNHMLWETMVFPHVTCKAIWQSGFHAQAYQDAIDKLYLHLRHRAVPVNDATVTAPALITEPQPDYTRATTHWQVYLRLDFTPADCDIELASDEPIPLAPGALAVVSGFRRQRVRGNATLLTFGIDLPHVARTDALTTEALRLPEVGDGIVFSAATALPLSSPLPGPGPLTAQLEWAATRYRLEHRHLHCPVVRRFLIEGSDPGSATPDELEVISGYGTPGRRGREGITCGIGTLTQQQCDAIRAFAEDHMTSVAADSVDDYPEYQVNLNSDILTRLIGEEAAANILRLTEHAGAPAGLSWNSYQEVSIMVRVYSPETRTYITFHSDTCDYTVNIALSDKTEFMGGDLIALSEGRLQKVPCSRGAAAAHSSHLVHGVSKIRGGNRYSLIIFFTLSR
jgi:hypothetical protein